MAAELGNGRDLTARLAEAMRDYEATWKPIDGELYDLCRRRSHDDFEDVYTKVAIVGRVYQAGVLRAWRGEGKAETKITYVLLEQAALIKNGLEGLEGQPFNRQTARRILELHGAVTTAISHRSGNVFLNSFVSKYFHFHSPIVPVYDSIAQARIGTLVDWRLVNPIRQELIAPLVGMRAYRNFVAAFLALQQQVYIETELTPAVKQLDHLLWRS